MNIKIGSLEYKIELGSFVGIKNRESSLKELAFYTELMLKSYLELETKRIEHINWRESMKFQIKKDLASTGEDITEGLIASRLIRSEEWLEEQKKLSQVKYSYKVLREVIIIIKQRILL